MASVQKRRLVVAIASASGPFLAEGMVIAPCSMKTLSAAAHAQAEDLFGIAWTKVKRGQGLDA